MEVNQESHLKIFIITVALIAVVFIGVVAYSGYRQYQFQESPEGLAITEKETTDRIATTAEVARVVMLSADKCESRVNQLIKANAESKITVLADIPQPLRDDLVFCTQRDLMQTWKEDSLRKLGLLSILRNGIL